MASISWSERRAVPMPIDWKPRRGEKNPNWSGGTKIDGNGYRQVTIPDDWPVEKRYPYVPEHHVVVWQARNKRPLPPKAKVHHIDGNRLNNAPSNLVVCEDNNYHFLLHLRQRARDACGNPSYMRCKICGVYDNPVNLILHKKERTGRHRACHADAERRRIGRG